MLRLTYFIDLGDYPESQGEPAESVSREAEPKERVWVSAIPAPVEDI